MNKGSMKPDLTMFSDASVQPQKEKNGWGFWIKGDGRDSMHAGGPLKNYTPRTEIAELEAMANGIHCAVCAEYFRNSDQFLMLQTDSVQALQCLLLKRPDTIVQQHESSAKIYRRKKPLNKRQSLAVSEIFKMLDAQGLTPVLRHVRGHTAGGGRNYVNRLCDRLAKKGVKKAA